MGDWLGVVKPSCTCSQATSLPLEVNLSPFASPFATSQVLVPPHGPFLMPAHLREKIDRIGCLAQNTVKNGGMSIPYWIRPCTWKTGSSVNCIVIAHMRCGICEKETKSSDCSKNKPTPCPTRKKCSNFSYHLGPQMSTSPSITVYLGHPETAITELKLGSHLKTTMSLLPWLYH